MSLLGYARVSTGDQHLESQLDALKEAGCERTWQEKVSGAKAERAELEKLLDYARPGDVVVVWKLDRLGRSLRHLVDTVAGLQGRGVEFRSLKENIDTTTATGRLIFHIFASLAEFERDILRERTGAGLASARARGRLGGRKRILSPAQTRLIRQLLEGGATVSSVAVSFKVSRPTIYRALEVESVTAA